MAHSRFRGIESAAEARDIQVLQATSVPSDTGAHAISLDGQWRRLAIEGDCSAAALDDTSWPSVSVPNCYGTEPALSRYFGPVWYRRKIALPHARTGNWLDLEFTSADYFSEVYLDGELLGRHEGYFAPFSFDVSGRARPGSVLAVKIECPLEELDPSKYLVEHRKRQIKGVLNYHDSRPGGMPGASTPGWTPVVGQSMPTGGITGGVRLRATGPVRIDAVFATPSDKQLNIAVLATNRTAEPLGIELGIAIEGLQSYGGVVGATLDPGANRIDLTTELADAAIWSPDASGLRPALYDMTATALAQGAVSDSRSTTFGFRNFVLEDPSAQSWVFRLNNKPVPIRGANYIPTQHLAGLDEDWYRRDLALAADLGLNSLGLHAHQQPAAFYDAADRAGLLIFQDFSLQWNYESDESLNRGFRERAPKMAAEMAYVLWNHPSVVYWCCHNEPPYAWAPEPPEDDAADPDNQALDRLLRDRLAAIDPSRPVIGASGVADSHKYEGSLAGGTLGDFATEPAGFVSEFGFPAPGWSSALWGDQGWPPDSENLREWAGRLSCFGTTATYVGAPERYSCPQDWIYACQRYGAHLLKCQAETMRTWASSNFMVHMLTDWWGYAGMGLVDVDRRSKLGYRWLRDALAPLKAVIAHPRNVFAPGEAVSLPVWVVSDRDHDTNALVVTWRLCRMRETEIITSDPSASVLGGTGIAAPENHSVALPRGEGAVSELETGQFYSPVNARSSVMAGEISFTTPAESPCGYTVFLDWENPLGEMGSNWFHFAVAGDPLQPGLWPAPRFDLEVGAGEAGRRSRVHIVRKFRPSDGYIEAYTGEGGVAHFTGLPPDCYEITSPVTARSATFELWENSAIDLS